MNILIVDSNSYMVGITKKAIEYLPFVGKIEKADTSSYAMELCQSGYFECYILEEYLSGGEGGIELAKRIKSAQKNAIIVLITGFPEKSLIDRAFKSGIDDFVRKDALRDELGHRVTRQYQYKTSNTQPNKVMKFEGLAYYPDTHSFNYDGQSLNLTKGQKELLAIFVISPAVLLSREQLRSKLWGDDYSDTFSKPRNLPERIYELKNALPKELRKYIVSVRGEGYIFHV